MSNLSLVGILVGFVLIVIPEPATTAAGIALTTASVGVRGASGAGAAPEVQ